MPKGARRVRMKPEARREQILAAAAQVFFEKGYDHASIRDLSRAAQTSIAGMYHHFADKEQVLFSLLDFAVDQLLERQRAAAAMAGGPRQRLEAKVRALVSVVVEHRCEVTLLFHEGHRLKPEHHQIIYAKQRQSVDLLKRELAAMHEAGSLKDIEVIPATFALLGMVNWLIYWYDPKGPLDPGRVATDFGTIFLDGVLREPGGPARYPVAPGAADG